MVGFQVVGQRIPLIDSNSKGLGETQYVDDLSIGSMLWGKILRSPFPHAKILHIDTSRAKALPGIKAVITGEDIPEIKFGGYSQGGDEQYPLAIEKVRYVGEAVAAVAAIDEELAEEALDLIRVDYEPLPYIFDSREAMEPGAILIHENKERNISNKVVKAYGDIEKGFREADYVREDTFRTAPNNHAALEPHGTICKWHTDGSLTIMANTQQPFRLRGRLYNALGLTEDKVRVIKTPVGGGIVIEINMEGGVNILSGAADIGQGTDTILCQIVAEELGVRMEDTRIVAADTAITPFDVGSFGSGVTFRVGNAAIKASHDVRKQLLEVIPLQLEAPPEKIEFSNGRIYIEDRPERGMTFKEAIKAYQNAGKPMPLIGRGFYELDCLTPEEAASKQGPETMAYSFYCHGAEVKVDKDTGEVRILKMVTAVDCGKAINPLNVEGQAEGSMIGGLSFGMYEDRPQKEGKYLNTSLLDYLIPTAMDLPQSISSILIETKDPFGPFGAKEAGEGMLVPVSPAIANAICDASGGQINELPITPDKTRSVMGAKNRNHEAEGGISQGGLS